MCSFDGWTELRLRSSEAPEVLIRTPDRSGFGPYTDFQPSHSERTQYVDSFMDKRIVIIGSGPCGLGAALRLSQLGHRNFLVLEASDDVGGLASSVVDKEGFLWDMGK